MQRLMQGCMGCLPSIFRDVIVHDVFVHCPLLLPAGHRGLCASTHRQVQEAQAAKPLQLLDYR